MGFFWLFYAVLNTVLHFLISDADIAQTDGKYLIAILLCTVALILALAWRYRKERYLFIILLLGYVLRMAFLLWTTYCNDIFLLPNAGIDEMSYYWSTYRCLYYNTNDVSGYHLLSLLFARWTGLSLLYVKYFNLLLSFSAICVVDSTICRFHLHPKTRPIAITIACLLPNFALLSGLHLREAPIYLLTALACYSFVIWWRENVISAFAFALLFSAISAWLHSGMLALTAGFLCVLITSRQEKERRVFTFNFRTVFVSVLAFAAIMIFTIGSGVGGLLGLTQYFRGAVTIEDVMQISENYEAGGSAYNATFIPGKNIFAFLLNTPVRIFYFLFSPLPWDWRGLNDIVSFFMSALIYLITLVLSIRYAARERKDGFSLTILILEFIVFFVFAWGCSNAGTAMRHRDKLMPLTMILITMNVNYLLKIREKASQQNPTRQKRKRQS